MLVSLYGAIGVHHPLSQLHQHGTLRLVAFSFLVRLRIAKVPTSNYVENNYKISTASDLYNAL